MSSMSLERGATLGVLTVLAERALSFVTLLVVARVLEPERFGVYVYLLAGLMPIQVMADQGLEVAATALISRRGRTSGSALATLLLGRLALWLGVGLPVAVAALPRLSGCPVATALAASCCMLTGPSMPYRTLHRARGEMGRVWVIACADAGGTLVATVAALLLGGGVASVFVARAGVGIVVTTAAAHRAPVRPVPGRQWERVAGRLIDAAWPLALNAALLTFMVRTGQLIAMSLIGSEAVGELGAAARVAEMLSMLAEGVMMAAFPAMAAQPRRATKLADDVSGVLGVLVAWAVAVTVAGAGPMVRLLYGPGYAAAARVLAILAWGGLVSAAGSVVFYRLVVADRQRFLLRMNAIAAAAALAMQLGLVWAAGIVGAAVGTVLTLVAGQALLCVDREARRLVVATWRRVLPPALVAVGAIAAARVVGGGWGAVAVALGVYPVAAVAAGLVREPERRALATLWAMARSRVAGSAPDG
jgi:O-antigen/teichoic acid export membrane protein